MKRWLRGLFAEVVLNTLAIVLASIAFWSGFAFAVVLCELRDDRGEALRSAQAAHLRKLTEQLGKTVAGPEVYRPANGDQGPGARGQVEEVAPREELPEPTSAKPESRLKDPALEPFPKPKD